jgi:acyl-CoA thioesterase
MHLHRQPTGEWICLAARTHLNSDGIGIAEGVLYDRQGRIGAALQSLVVEARG